MLNGTAGGLVWERGSVHHRPGRERLGQCHCVHASVQKHTRLGAFEQMFSFIQWDTISSLQAINFLKRFSNNIKFSVMTMPFQM